jgi:hypothetical protein
MEVLLTGYSSAVAVATDNPANSISWSMEKPPVDMRMTSMSAASVAERYLIGADGWLEDDMAIRHELSGPAAAKERGGREANEAMQSCVKKQAGNAGFGQAAPLLRNNSGKGRLAKAGRLRVSMVAI